MCKVNTALYFGAKNIRVKDLVRGSVTWEMKVIVEYLILIKDGFDGRWSGWGVGMKVERLARSGLSLQNNTCCGNSDEKRARRDVTRARSPRHRTAIAIALPRGTIAPFPHSVPFLVIALLTSIKAHRSHLVPLAHYYSLRHYYCDSHTYSALPYYLFTSVCI